MTNDNLGETAHQDSLPLEPRGDSKRAREKTAAVREAEDEMIWRDKEPTQKQLDLIAEMREFSEYPLPLFTGSTRGDAYDYIQKYGELSHESTWAIEHGY